MTYFARSLCLLIVGAATVSLPMEVNAQAPKPAAAAPPVQQGEIAPADRIEAKDLATSLQKGASPLLLQVGPRSLYDQGHILNAQYAGPASSEAGLAALRESVQAISRDRWIVLYCGCCPWDRCPNIRPALRHLHERGYTHVQVLYLPTSFAADWVDRGFPTEK